MSHQALGFLYAAGLGVNSSQAKVSGLWTRSVGTVWTVVRFQSEMPLAKWLQLQYLVGTGTIS